MYIEDEIAALKKEKQAIILAHYYVPDEVQEYADFVGDSFGLAKKAIETDAKVIVFAGVDFMGESAKMLNPEKKVLMPNATASCPMAHMADVKTIEKVRSQYDDLAVVCYVNSTAAVKAVSDVCVTSSNAVKIVRKLPNKHIFFTPDRNLGHYVSTQVPDKHFILNDGFCPRHDTVDPAYVKQVQAAHPQALFLAHPECRKEVLALADYVGSTSGIIDYAGKSDAKEFIIGTEGGVFYELETRNPGKTFYPAMEDAYCINMKKVTLEKVRDCLRDETNEVRVDPDVAGKAVRSLERMLEFGVGFDGPLAVRYPRGQAYRGLSEFDAPVEYGKAEMLFEEKDIALFALGSMVSTGEHVREKLKARGYSCTLVNARFVKPLDTDMIDRLCRSHKLIVTLEENVLRGGMGMCATRYIHEHHPEIHVIQGALPDAYVEHGNVSLLREMLGIDSDSVIKRIFAEYLDLYDSHGNMKIQNSFDCPNSTEKERQDP